MYGLLFVGLLLLLYLIGTMMKELGGVLENLALTVMDMLGIDLNSIIGYINNIIPGLCDIKYFTLDEIRSDMTALNPGTKINRFNIGPVVDLKQMTQNLLDPLHQEVISLNPKHTPKICDKE